MSRKEPLYSSGLNSQSEPYVDGPGEHLNYYAGYLFPQFSFSNLEDAKVGALVAQQAYDAGYKQAQAEIRKVLGVK